jgi:hypothetical protein
MSPSLSRRWLPGHGRSRGRRCVQHCRGAAAVPHAAARRAIPGRRHADVLPRVLVEKVHAAYPAGVVVENRAGAGGA